MAKSTKKDRKKDKKTKNTMSEKSALLTLAKEFYIQRFVREEEAKTELTKQDFLQILRQFSYPE